MSGTEDIAKCDQVAFQCQAGNRDRMCAIAKVRIQQSYTQLFNGYPDVNLLRLIADGYVIATFCDVLLSIWPDPDPSEFSFVGVWLERDAHRRKYEIPPQ